MRILHTVAPAPVGGLEDVVIRLAGGLERRGHAVTVAAVFGDLGDPHPFRDELDRVGIRSHAVEAPGRGYLREISELTALCDTFRPDILHTHGYRPDVIHPFAARASGTPLVSTLHGFTGGGWRNRLYEHLQMRSVRQFDAVVAVSRAMAGPLRERGVPERALRVIPNAWEARVDLASATDARTELGVAPGRFHIGSIGRLSAEKGPDVLLEAMFRSSADGESERPIVSFIGDGPLRGMLQSKAEASDRAEFRFHGMVPGAARLLRAFDVLVLSSRTEGTPIVLFEAMEASVPIVASRVGGVPDLLDAMTGLLVPSEDPLALAEAVLQVRAGPKEARARAEEARRRLHREFAVEPWLSAYERVYESIV